MKSSTALNPMIFVKDENDPEFRAYILRRAKDALDPKNRHKLLTVAEAREKLLERRKHFMTHG